MKKGYHSTQSKAFNTIPRSEYLGVVLGFAIGMFLTGALHWDNRILELIGARNKGIFVVHSRHQFFLIVDSENHRCFFFQSHH